MAININMVDKDTVILNDVLRIKDGPNGLQVKFLTTPGSKWVDNAGNGVPSGGTVEYPTRSWATLAGQPATQVASPGTDALTYDPHYYRNGNNGLTVAESARRVVERLYYQTWGNFTPDATGEPDDINKVVRELIRNNKGRDYAYTLGGRVKNMKEGKGFDSYTCAEVFQWAALMDGAIEKPVFV